MRAGVIGAALALASCYSPSLRDCTVSCTAATDCANGQVCGSDHRCAAPAVSCSADAAVDASPRDAAVDALPPPPDSSPFVTLHVHVDGSGLVSVLAVGACDSMGPTHGDCMYDVIAGVPLELDATPHAGFDFDSWSGGPCDQADASCTFTPTTNVDLHARFKNDH